MRSATRRATAALVFATLGGLPGIVHGAVTVNYAAQAGTTSASPITIGGITATETNGGTLTLANGLGLGVVGGADFYIDQSESVMFHFDAGPAVGVSYSSILGAVAPNTPAINLEGFGASGASLGTVTFDAFDVVIHPLDISGLFGDVPLSGFRISGNGSDTRTSVSSITYTTAGIAAVPEPGAIAMLASGVPIGLLAWRRRRAA